MFCSWELTYNRVLVFPNNERRLCFRVTCFGMWVDVGWVGVGFGAGDRREGVSQWHHLKVSNMSKERLNEAVHLTRGCFSEVHLSFYLSDEDSAVNPAIEVGRAEGEA